MNIVRFNEIDNVTYYEILVKCGNVFWTVSVYQINLSINDPPVMYLGSKTLQGISTPQRGTGSRFCTGQVPVARKESDW